MATHFYRCKLRAHNLNKIYIWLVGFCLQLKAKDQGNVSNLPVGSKMLVQK